jgi:D-inositol-3-phosphate glycosyltransferase
MIPKNGLRIIFYDPSSGGGICHYTHQLAENLAQMGQDVIVVTNEGYELSHLKKTFRTYFLFKRSSLKSLLGWVLHWSKKKTSNQENASPGSAVDLRGVAVQKGLPLDVLKAARLRITFLKGALFFIWNRPDIVHFQRLIDPNQDYYFARWLKTLGIKIVYTAHDLLPHDYSTNTDREALGKIYTLADRVIVHSKSDRSELMRTFGIDYNQISVIPHGSNSLFCSSEEISKSAARKGLGIDGDKKIILFFGFIRRYKGLEYLIEAFNRIKNDVPDAVLLIAGTIYEGDRDRHKYYSELIRECRRQDDISCRTEYIPLERVNDYFSAADVVVLPYIKTYTSGVLLSAYAAGRPVVVTDTGALKEVVEEGKSGYVVPPENVAALAEAISKTLSNSEQLETMGRYAKLLADTRYSWATAAAKTIAVYRSLLGQPQLSGVQT